MRPADFLFKIVERNKLIPSEDVDKLKDDCKAWIKEMGAKEGTIEAKIAKWVLEKQEIWYWRIILAIAFVPINAWVWDIGHPGDDDDDDEDDD